MNKLKFYVKADDGELILRMIENNFHWDLLTVDDDIDNLIELEDIALKLNKLDNHA